LLFVPDEAVHVDANLAAYGSEQLWRRWQCVPLQVPGQGATLGATSPLSEDVRLCANRLTGTNLQVALLTPISLEGALGSLPEGRAAPYSPEHHLFEAGLVHATDELLTAASQLAKAERIPLVQAFIRTGSATVEDLVEAQAI